MVLGRAEPTLPSLVVPDELALTVWGHDPHARGLHPITTCGAASALLVAEPLPMALRAARVQLEAALREDAARETVTLAGPAAVAGKHAGGDTPVDGRTGGAPHCHTSDADEHGNGTHAEHSPDKPHGETEHADSGHQGHEHGDMMAITGEPSADGLVMERIEFSYGPLLTALPGGVVLGLELDGDVVSRCTARATLHVAQPSDGARVPDPLASSAWTAVLEAAAESRAGFAPTEATRWRRIAEVELERAVSHLAWLRVFARLLGWMPLLERVQPALDALADARAEARSGSEALDLAAAATGEVLALMRHRRAWGARTRQRGLLDGGAHVDLYGPNARAAGVGRDARTLDRLYTEVGFEPVVEQGADAHARTLVRAREAVDSIRLAGAALGRAASATGRSSQRARESDDLLAVEGPRGPLTARATDDGLVLAAPGEHAAISVAGHAAIGREWAAALVGIASLDLSPWRVGG